MAKPIRVLSFDFDGSLFNRHYINDREKNVIKSNLFLLNKLKEASANFSKTIVLVGSNRQSLKDDRINGGYGKGSCFPRVMEVAAYLGATLDRFLMADIYSDNKSGYAFDNAMSKMNAENTDYDPKKANAGKSPEWVHDKGKLTLLYAQMHKVASENKNEEIEFIFSDDREDILNPLFEFFSKHRELIPSNLKLTLQYYEGPIDKDEQEFSPELILPEPRQIQGCGKIDRNYRITVKTMVTQSLQAAFDAVKPIEGVFGPIRNLDGMKRNDYNVVSPLNTIEFYIPSIQKNPSVKKGFIIGGLLAIGMGAGVAIGLALSMTGVFAPLGSGVLGISLMAAMIGSIGLVGGAALRYMKLSCFNHKEVLPTHDAIANSPPGLKKLGGSKMPEPDRASPETSERYEPIFSQAKARDSVHNLRVGNTWYPTY